MCAVKFARDLTHRTTERPSILTLSRMEFKRKGERAHAREELTFASFGKEKGKGKREISISFFFIFSLFPLSPPLYKSRKK